MASDKALASVCCRMEILTMETGKKTKWREMGSTNGLRNNVSMKVNGKLLNSLLTFKGRKI